jgi:hypothetical protein
MMSRPWRQRFTIKHRSAQNGTNRDFECSAVSFQRIERDRYGDAFSVNIARAMAPKPLAAIVKLNIRHRGIRSRRREYEY